MVRLGFGFLLAINLCVRPALAIDFQPEYGLENDASVGEFMYKCFSLVNPHSKSEWDHEEAVCSMRAKELTLLEYSSMQDGCSTFNSESTALSECAHTVTKLNRHFAADMPPVALPPMTVYEQALLAEGCARLTDAKRILCQSGTKKLYVK